MNKSLYKWGIFTFELSSAAMSIIIASTPIHPIPRSQRPEAAKEPIRYNNKELIRGVHGWGMSTKREK